jgi:hypothetical protein
MPRKTLTIPRFPQMTLHDAIALGTRRLVEDGYADVRFDPASVVRRTSVDDERSDWRLVFLVVDPDAPAH